MNHPGHILVNGRAVASSAVFPAFITPQRVPRQLTLAERRLRALPWRRDCFVNKIIQLLDVREQYRQRVLIVERRNMAALPCDRCASTTGERTFEGVSSRRGVLSVPSDSYFTISHIYISQNSHQSRG